MEPTRPLAGIRVIDFSTLVAGPWCGRLLADCGAEVIKVESAGEGDVLRHSSPIPGGISRTFAHFNCGKQCVALDLKTAAGAGVARALISRADVVIENFRPGVMDRLGLGAESLRAADPRLVYCSVSGFGQTGPRSQQAAYAPIVHALSGFDRAFMSTNGGAQAPPASAIMIADVIAAVYAFGAIQTALLRRERDGIGAALDATLFESMLSIVAIQIQEAQAPVPVAPKVFRPTRTADGFVMIPLVSPRNYRALYPAIGRSEWCADPAFGSRRGIAANECAIERALADWAGPRTTAEVVEAMVAAGLPCSAYHTPAEVLADDHLAERGAFEPLEDAHGAFSVLNPPFRFADVDCTAVPGVGALGEHTREVLESVLAVDAATFAELARAGAFGAATTPGGSAA
jgi:crotonobetainyl-CoA:carnitine CoA-transferase CaiB-like acyl-CoA transferase